MSFSFNTTAGASQSTVKPRLEPNMIHTVKFGGAELKDFNGKKDTSAKYSTIVFRFENEDGYYEHTIFEPNGKDFERETKIVKVNGVDTSITSPSNVESIMLFFKHLIDTVNPKVAKQIDEGKGLAAGSWNELRNLVKKIVDAGKAKDSSSDIEFQIKLLKNKNGEAVFPGFFTGLSKDGKAYVKNNFIGEKLMFSAYEHNRIVNEANAAPTNMAAKVNAGVTSSVQPSVNDGVGDLNSSFDGIDLDEL